LRAAAHSSPHLALEHSYRSRSEPLSSNSSAAVKIPDFPWLDLTTHEGRGFLAIEIG
jgi:hypothetical protein